MPVSGLEQERCGLVDVGVRREDVRVAGHTAADRFGFNVEATRNRFENVALGDDPGEPALFDHTHRSDPGRCHFLGSLRNRYVGSAHLGRCRNQISQSHDVPPSTSRLAIFGHSIAHLE
jgi:hypothetical protein